MRVTITVLMSVVALAFGQVPHGDYQQSSQHAAIISDARYLAGDGTFGAAYSQEDGVEFKEESDINGDRRGSYSYVDPTGQRRTVTYTAGKNGFQATGDHIPSAPPPTPPQPEYVPLAQYNPPDYQPPAHQHPQPHYTRAYQRQYEPSYEVQPEYEPQPRPQIQYQYRPQLQPQYQPQYRPQPQVQHQPHSQIQYELESIPSYNFRHQHRPPPRHEPPQLNAITPVSPRRFSPPGKLDFNRTPDGFSYTFSKS